MCGRITLLTPDELVEVVDGIRRKQAARLATRSHEERLRDQARVGNQVTAIVCDDRRVNSEQLSWGVKPEWGNKPVFNTRIETALGKGGMWQQAIREGRCILPAASFFEPHVTETERSPKTGRTVKRAYEFWLPDEEPLLLASVRQADQLSVVTTEPNVDVSPIHPRMPLILRFDEVPVWLEGDLGDIARLTNRSAIRLHSTPELRSSRSIETGKTAKAPNAIGDDGANSTRRRPDSSSPDQLSLF